MPEKIIGKMVKAPEGDFRNWQEIRAWAEELLQTGFVGLQGVSMEDIYTYQILVRGQAAEVDLQPFCPPGLTLEQLELNTLLTIRTDQSGIIGLIRNLHGLGLMFLSVNCLAQTTDTIFADNSKLGWRKP